MLRLVTTLSYAAALVAVMAGSSNVWAVLTVTNGGFDAQGPELNNNPTVSPTGWFTSSVAVDSFSDSILNSQNGAQGRWLGNALQLGNNSPFAADGSTETGYAYQSLGTYTAEASITVLGYVFNRIAPANEVGNFDVGIYVAPPNSFTPADGNDVAFNAFLAGSQVFTQGTDFAITTGTTAQRAPWSFTATLTGLASPGDTIWLRIGDAGNPLGTQSDEPIIDDVNLAPFDLGDVNGDGLVDIATDFAAIRNNFRKTVTSRAQGDLDGSGDVDFLDYLQWRQKFLNVGGVAADIPALFGVPEPGALGLASIALGFGVGAARRRSRRG